MREVMTFFKVTDYAKFVDLAEDGYKFVVEQGDFDEMLKCDSIEETVNGITKKIFSDYLRQRCTHVITISLADDFEIDDLINIPLSDIQQSFEDIIESFQEEYPDVLIINKVPYDILSFSGAYITLSRRFSDLFVGNRFHEISGWTHDIYIPTGVMIYMESLGGNGLIDNLNKFW